jgi:hypothetical protein
MKSSLAMFFFLSTLNALSFCALVAISQDVSSLTELGNLSFEIDRFPSGFETYGESEELQASGNMTQVL